MNDIYDIEPPIVTTTYGSILLVAIITLVVVIVATLVIIFRKRRTLCPEYIKTPYEAMVAMLSNDEIYMKNDKELVEDILNGLVRYLGSLVDSDLKDKTTEELVSFLRIHRKEYEDFFWIQLATFLDKTHAVRYADQGMLPKDRTDFVAEARRITEWINTKENPHQTL